MICVYVRGQERHSNASPIDSYLNAAATAAKALQSPGSPDKSEHRRADALQYCFGLNNAASAI